MKEFFTINELATMTMLTTRTLRNYISQGLLKGEKIGGAWQFSPENIDAFFKEDIVVQSIQSKKNGMVYEYMSNDTKSDNMVCSLYDYTNLEKDEADKICASILTLVNSNKYGNVRFSYTFSGKKKTVRVTLIGRMIEIHNLMSEFITMQ